MQLDRQFFVKVFAEFCATAIMMQLQCLGEGAFARSFIIPLGWGWNTGMTIMVVMQIFGHISGAHINPCITVAAVIVQQIKWHTALVYVVCQFLGAIVGLVVAYYITPAYENGLAYCVTEPADQITLVGALLLEFCMTATWVLAQCTVWDPRSRVIEESMTLRMGCVVLALTVSTGYFTGCSMNPARSFAGALFNMRWESVWIYFVSPLCAAVLMAFLHKYILNDGDEGTDNIA